MRYLSEQQRHAIVAMRARGALFKQIAHQVGVHEATARRVCRQAGVGKVYSQHKGSVKARRWYAAQKAKRFEAFA